MKKLLLGGVGTFALLAVVVGGTTAFFSSQASVTGNTFAAGTLELALTENEGGSNPVSALGEQWSFSNMAPGGTPESASVWLRNVGTIPGATLSLEIPGGWSNPSNIAAQMRITELTFDGENLLTGGAGAVIPEYETPEDCDVTVSGGSGLATALTGAAAGEVVCVDSGSYSPGSVTVTVDDVTVVGLNDPSGSDRALVQGTIVAGANNLAVRGLALTNPTGRTVVQATGVNGLTVTENVIENVGTDSSAVSTGGVQAVYVQAAASIMSDFEVSYNRFTGIGNADLSGSNPAGSSAKAIYFGDTSGGNASIDNVLIAHNVISNVSASNATFGDGGRGAYGFLANNSGDTTNLVVEHNTISDLSGWWEQGVSLFNGTPGAIVRLNDMSDFASGVGSAAGVNVESNPNASSVVIEENNFDNSVATGVFNQTGDMVTAQNNWWGGFTTTEVGNVDAGNFAGGPFVGFVNDDDTNSNGFADLRDLRDQDISGITPGLDPYDGSNDKEFVMSVQLDGPTTGNTFQGLSLEDMEILFTLEQI